MDTSCKECIFAEYNGITQTACKLDLLKNFKQVDECYDETKEFFVIRNKLCMFKRTDSWIFSKNEFEVQKEEVIKENDIKVSAFIIGGTYEDDIIYSIDRIREMKFKPITLSILNIENLNTEKMIKALKKLQIYKWDIVNNVEKMSINDNIHSKMRLYKLQYYSIFRAGKYIPPSFLYDINEKVKNGQSFACLYKENTDHCLTVPLMIHNFWWYGSKEENIVKFLKEKEVECPTETSLVQLI